MTFKPLSPAFSAGPQLSEADIARAAQDGFSTIVDNRPDGEDPGQPDAAAMRALAEQHGLAFAHIPVTPGAIGDTDIAQMAAVLEGAPGPVLGYCRTGTRAAMLWALSQAGGAPPESLLQAAAEAGFDLTAIKPRLVTLAAGGRGVE